VHAAHVVHAVHSGRVPDRAIAPRRPSWQPTLWVFHNRAGRALNPRKALQAIKAAAKRAKLPSAAGLHTLLPRLSCPLACRSRWSLRSSVTRAMRSRETYADTSVQRVSREALTQLSDALPGKKGGQT
jgi:hypothetical protein